MSQPITLKQFQTRQAITDGVINFVLVGVIHYFLLKPLMTVPLTNGWTNIDPSVFGFINPLAILLTFIVSFMTFRATIMKRRQGKVLPPLSEDTKWSSTALKTARFPALIAAIIVIPASAIAGAVIPEHTVDPLVVLTIIMALAAGLATYASARAVGKTAALS